MKKTILFLLLSAVSFLHSQECGFYMSGYGSGNWMNVDKIDGVSLDLEPGWTAAGAIGYRLNRSSRVEIEGAYRQNDFDHVKAKGLKVGAGGHANTTSVMVNLYQDMDFFFLPVTPYVGIGSGYAVIKDKIDVAGIFYKGTGKGYAWQAMTGLSCPLISCVEAAVEYRYFKARDKTKDHSVGVSLRYYF